MGVRRLHGLGPRDSDYGGLGRVLRLVNPTRASRPTHSQRAGRSGELAAKEEEAANDERRKWATERHNALVALILEGDEMAANLPGDTYNDTMNPEVTDWLLRVNAARQDANISSGAMGGRTRFVIRYINKETLESELLTLRFRAHDFATIEGVLPD